MQLSIAPGFENPPLDSAQNFRVLLDAMAHPGKIYDVAFDGRQLEPLNLASMVTMLALTDHETGVWLAPAFQTESVLQFIRFHCGVRMVDKSQDAVFGFFDSCPDVKTLQNFPTGTPEYPDRSATLIIQVDRFSEGGNITLSGPGIKITNHISIEGPDDIFWAWTRRNSSHFPLGIDIIFTCDDQVMALPRSTQILETI